MRQLSKAIIDLIGRQHFVVISTIDENSRIHCAAKGVVKSDPEGKVYLIDLYRGNTFSNIKRSPVASITAIDEYRFIGYTLKGRARIVEKKDFDQSLVKDWEEKMVSRISDRLIKRVQNVTGVSRHPEAHLPPVQYLIELEVEDIVDLTPAHIKKHGL